MTTVIDETDLPWIGNVVDVVEEAVGQPWRIALERLERIAAPAYRLTAVVGAIRWVLGGRARNAPLARRARGLVLGHPALDSGARGARIRAAAAALGIVEQALETMLWSDLPREREVELPAGRPAELEVAAIANVQLIQRAIRRAQTIRIRVWGDSGAIIRAAAYRGLLATAAVGGEGETVLEIVGPLALCHQTAIYGRVLAGLVPLLAECGRFVLELETRTYTTHLESPVLLPYAPAYLGAPNRIASRLANELEAAGVAVTRAPPPIAAGTSLVFPDLMIERNGICSYLELVGFWTAGHLARKAATYREANIDDVILCVDDARSCADDAPPPDVRLIRYRRRILCADVMALVG